MFLCALEAQVVVMLTMLKTMISFVVVAAVNWISNAIPHYFYL
jgi:hypothetical protein